MRRVKKKKTTTTSESDTESESEVSINEVSLNSILDKISGLIFLLSLYTFVYAVFPFLLVVKLGSRVADLLINSIDIMGSNLETYSKEGNLSKSHTMSLDEKTTTPESGTNTGPPHSENGLCEECLMDTMIEIIFRIFLFPYLVVIKLAVNGADLTMQLVAVFLETLLGNEKRIQRKLDGLRILIRDTASGSKPSPT